MGLVVTFTFHRGTSPVGGAVLLHVTWNLRRAPVNTTVFWLCFRSSHQSGGGHLIRNLPREAKDCPQRMLEQASASQPIFCGRSCGSQKVPEGTCQKWEINKDNRSRTRTSSSSSSRRRMSRRGGGGPHATICGTDVRELHASEYLPCPSPHWALARSFKISVHTA